MQEIKKHCGNLVVVAIVAAFIVAAILIGHKNQNQAQSKDPNLLTYADTLNNFSLQYPKDFIYTKAQVSSNGETLIDFNLKEGSNTSDSEIFEVTVEKDSTPSVSIADRILKTYTDKRKGDLAKLNNPGAEGVGVIIRKPAGEIFHYDYFRVNENIYLLSYRERYFRNGNTLMLVNNSNYFNAYLKILNSMKFSL